MKQVFLIFSADANLMNDSKILLAVCTTKSKAIALITPELIKVSNEDFTDHTYNNSDDMLADLLFSLDKYNQTQILSDNFMIEEIELDTISL